MWIAIILTSAGLGRTEAGVSFRLRLERPNPAGGEPAAELQEVNLTQYDDLTGADEHDKPITYPGLIRGLTAQFAGAKAEVFAEILPPQIDLNPFPMPQMHAYLSATVPQSTENITYLETVELQFEDVIRIDLLRSSPLLAAVKPVFHLNAPIYSRNPAGITYAKPAIATIWQITWGDVAGPLRRWDTLQFYDESGNPAGERPLSDSLTEQLNEKFEAPSSFHIIQGIHLKIFWRTVLHISQSSQGKKSAEFKADKSLALDGLIPYDAQGNVLPASALVVTSDEGWSYPILSPGSPDFKITDAAYDPAANRLSLTWNSVPGKSYILQTSSDFSTWVSMPGVVPSGGERTRFDQVLSPTNSSSRYFRVEEAH